MMLRDARRAVVYIYSSDEASSRWRPPQARTHEAFCILREHDTSVGAIIYYALVATPTDEIILDRSL